MVLGRLALSRMVGDQTHKLNSVLEVFFLARSLASSELRPMQVIGLVTGALESDMLETYWAYAQ